MNSFMPPPPVGPINDSGGQFTQNKPNQSGQFQPVFNFHFNPGGGLGNSGGGGIPGGGFGQRQPIGVTDQPQYPSLLRPGMGPMRVPPPVGLGGGIPGGGSIRPGGGPMRVPPPVGLGGGMPGWAGYLQWLNMMGNRFPPPPPIQPVRG